MLEESWNDRSRESNPQAELCDERCGKGAENARE
jgi:hypothetical protein